MLGIIVALDSEININDITKDYKIYNVDGFKCYVFDLLNKPIVLIYSGVGKVNAAITTHILINHFKVNLIINAGLCGSVSDKVDIGTFIIPRFISYYDVDATAFGYEINQIPHEEKQFEVKNEWVNNLQKWITSFGNKAIIDLIASGDSFINKENFNKFNIKEGIAAIDMESCAIAQTCYKTNTDFCFIKLVSDYVYDSKSSSQQWDEAIKNFSHKLTDVLINICYQINYLNY